MQSPELGEFLRACRAKIDPADVGLPRFGVRRVVGLRREEVASLAGISSDYYTRLEQGRERNPSGQVIGAIARALHLQADGREHLFRLAGVVPAVRRPSSAEEVDPALLRLLDSLHNVPAYVMNRILDILALNPLAEAIFEPFEHVDNMARMVFRDPASKAHVGDWQVTAENVVHSLRLAEGFDPHDKALRNLVAELLDASPAFAQLWHANTVRGLSQITNTITDPRIGLVEYTSLTFDVRGTVGQQLVIVFAEPGSRSAKALARLYSLQTFGAAGDDGLAGPPGEE
jgi:transcriptional regulator with XRE-family HTH domain